MQNSLNTAPRVQRILFNVLYIRQEALIEQYAVCPYTKYFTTKPKTPEAFQFTFCHMRTEAHCFFLMWAVLHCKLLAILLMHKNLIS